MKFGFQIIFLATYAEAKFKESKAQNTSDLSSASSDVEQKKSNKTKNVFNKNNLEEANTVPEVSGN